MMEGGRGRLCVSILLLSIIGGFPCLLNSQPTLVLKGEQQKFVLGPGLEILEDPSGRLTIADVMKPENSTRFVPCPSRIPSFGFTKSAFWVRISIRNESNRFTWALQLKNPNMDTIDFYLLTPEGAVMPVRKSGRMRPLKAAEHVDQLPVFFITFARSQTRTLFLRCQNDESMIIRLALFSMTSFVAQVGRTSIFMGIFLGILIIMIAYNLFIFFSLKDKSYLYFSLFMAAILSFSLSFRGIGLHYLWPDWPVFNKLTLPLTSALMILAVMKFTDLFLMAKKRMPVIHRLINALMVVTGAFIVAIPWFRYHLVILPIMLIAGSGSIFILIAAILALHQGYRPALYLVAGYSVMSLGIIVFLLARLALLPSTGLTEEGFSIGYVLVILLMALALADRIKMLETEKEKIDQHLRQSEEQVHILTRAIEQSPVLIMLTDLQGRIEYVNPRFIEATGYSLEEVRGRNPRLLKSGETPTSVYRELWQTITAGETWRGEFLNRQKNGELFWESALICPIKNNAGETTHYLGLMQDITEHKQLQEQLLQVQKMDSIGTLAGGIAHDFNNILTIIMGHTDLALEKSGANHPLFEDLSAIQAASEQAANLTRQILAFGRKQIYLPQVLDINQMISNMKNMLQRLIGEDIRIEMALAQGLPVIKADPGQIEQIFVNLMINARDAINEKTAKANEKKITIETGKIFLDDDYTQLHFGAQKGVHIFFSVSDTGTGIEESIRQKIFDPFFSTKEQGTGLGLATVYGIVKQNDASIFLYSEVGQGTTFKIYWPTSTEKITEALSLEPDLKELRGSERILLAEDDAAVANVAHTALAEAGYDVRVAANGRKALEMVSQDDRPIDMLVTDLVMPDMNGVELAEKIKQQIPEIRILYSSGYTDNHLVHNGELDNRIDFLQKPYSIVDLLKKVREILNRTP